MPLRVVHRTPELMRVARLPRRDPEKVASDKEIDTLTDHFKTPQGAMRLLPIQAAALIELYETGGWFGQAGVGKGKTLVTFLAPAVLKAKRPLLLVPAKLLKKTQREKTRYSKHWKIPPIRIESYEILSRTGGGAMLAGAPGVSGYFPDLILCDEAQALKNLKAACTAKVNAYVRACRKEHAK